MKLLSTLGSLDHPAWFGEDLTPVEPIRAAMLATLGPHVPDRLALLHSRIEYAADLQRLWYLRAPLMAALADLHGEAAAAQKLARLSALFRDHLPNGLASSLAPRTAPAP